MFGEMSVSWVTSPLKNGFLAKVVSWLYLYTTVEKRMVQSFVCIQPRSLIPNKYTYQAIWPLCTCFVHRFLLAASCGLTVQLQLIRSNKLTSIVIGIKVIYMTYSAWTGNVACMLVHVPDLTDCEKEKNSPCTCVAQRNWWAAYVSNP